MHFSVYTKKVWESYRGILTLSRCSSNVHTTPFKLSAQNLSEKRLAYRDVTHLLVYKSLTLHVKQPECQFLFKASTYFSPPVIARIHFPHFTEKRSSKHFSQYGLPESTKNPSLPKPRLQNEQTK